MELPTIAKSSILGIQSEEIDSSKAKEKLEQYDGILVAPGFGDRGIEGKIEAVKYAKLKKCHSSEFV